MAESSAYRSLVPADGAALITGASRGIGRAVALKLAFAGRPVGLIARSAGALDAVAAEARRLGAAAEPAPCDVTDPHQLADAVQHLRQRLGPTRVLVNNAGVFLDQPMPEITLEQWEHVLRVNLTASFVATQLVWPGMIKAGSGIILNIASKAATQGYVGQSAYCASKAGLLGWARAVALEGKKHHIRVHSICPGGVDTQLIAGTPLAERLAGQVMMQPEDIAEVVHFCICQPANVDLPEILMSRFET